MKFRKWLSALLIACLLIPAPLALMEEAPEAPQPETPEAALEDYVEEVTLTLGEESPAVEYTPATEEPLEVTIEGIESKSEVVDAEEIRVVAPTTAISIDNIHFPDANFRTYVLQEIDTDKDELLSDEEISNTINMDVRGKKISSMQGIEYFTVLEKLICSNNQLKQLDISNNTALKTLWIGKSGLTALDLHNNKNLVDLQCNGNPLNTLDVSNCTALEILNCENTQLATLNLNNCTKLRDLGCSNNKLEHLDISANKELETLECEHNKLPTLDITKNAKLTELRCYNNQIKTLDISRCPLLMEAYKYGIGIDEDGIANCSVEGTHQWFSFDPSVRLITGTNNHYNWEFGKDNFSFLNDPSYFKITDSYYVNQTDFESFLSKLTGPDVWLCANAYGQGKALSIEKIRNFYKNKLIKNDGSCYGMTLLAALFYEGMQNKSVFNVDSTYLIPFSKKIESLINIYQLSMLCTYNVCNRITGTIGTDEFVGFANELYDKAYKVGVGKHEVFQICFSNTNYAHATLCIGADEINTYTDLNTGIKYNRVIYLYDPNVDSLAKLYISENSRFALYSRNRNVLHVTYINKPLSILGEIGKKNTDKKVFLIGDKSLSIELRFNSGRVGIDKGEIKYIDGVIPQSVNRIINYYGDSDDDIVLYSINGSYSDYTIEPYNSNVVNASLVFDSTVVGINGMFESSSISKDGKIQLENASGPVEISVIKENSKYDLATVSGNANGNVSLSLDRESLYVGGEISDYTISNLNSSAITTETKVEGNVDIKATKDGDNYTVYKDNDGDGVYETPVKPKNEVIQLLNNKTTKTTEISKELTISLPDFSINSCKSSKPKVATVTNTGVISTHSIGKTTITVTMSNKKKRTLSLTVTDPTIPTGIRLDKSGTIEHDCNQTLKLNYTLLPEGTAVSGVTWKSSSTKIATVDANGLVKPLKEGKVTITATTTKGKKKYSAKVVLKLYDPKKPTGIHLNRTGTVSLDVTDDKTLTLVATVEPSTAESGVTWKSSSDKIASVKDGVVTLHKAGSATITATLTKIKKSAKVKLVIKDMHAPKSVSIAEGKNLTLTVGQSMTLTANVTGENGYAPRKNLTWSTSKSSIVTVNPATGAITALKAGKAKITVMTDNKKKASISIQVK